MNKKTDTLAGCTISVEAQAKPTTFYYQIEDASGNFSQVEGPFKTKDDAIKELARVIEDNDQCGVDIDDLDDLEDVRIRIFEVVSDTSYKAKKAGIAITERK